MYSLLIIRRDRYISPLYSGELYRWEVIKNRLLLHTQLHFQRDLLVLPPQIRAELRKDLGLRREIINMLISIALGQGMMGVAG